MDANSETLKIFQEAVRIDESLAGEFPDLAILTNKRLTSEKFSFEHLFTNLGDSCPCLYFDYGLRGNKDRCGLSISKTEMLSILRETRDAFRYEISRELDEEPIELTISELIREWDEDQRVLRITNLHLRTIDLVSPSELDLVCPFNLLTRGNEELQRLEMLTLMVSTTGGITESHSDDTDVNNHCIAGRKLWLCWDTSEGIKAGLEDCEKLDIHGKPKFSLETFLELESSIWMLVAEGETLFLPGNYTHKVITLEKYIGIGGFFVSFPTLLHTFERWLSRKEEFQYREPLYRMRYGDAMADIIESSLLDSSRETYRCLLSEDENAGLQWGIKYVGKSAKDWGQGHAGTTRADLNRDSRYRQCLALVHEMKNYQRRNFTIATEFDGNQVQSNPNLSCDFGDRHI